MKYTITLLTLVLLSMIVKAQTKVGIWEGFDVLDMGNGSYGDQICFDHEDRRIDCKEAPFNWHGNMCAKIIGSGVDVELYGVKFATFAERDWYNVDHQERIQGLCEMIKRSMAYFDSVGCDYVNISIGTTKHDVMGYVSPWKPKTKNDLYGRDRVDYANEYITQMGAAYREAFTKHRSITFVVSAGNEGGDVDDLKAIPANLYALDNVVVISDDDSYSNTCARCITVSDCDYEDEQGYISTGTSVCAPRWINTQIRE